MKRWLFNAAAGISLLLCVAAIVLWVRSYFVWERLRWIDGNFGNHTGVRIYGEQIFAASNCGLLMFQSEYSEYEGSGSGLVGPRFDWQKAPAGGQFISYATGIHPNLHFAGFGFDFVYVNQFDGMYQARAKAMILPVWSLVALTSVLPICQLIRWGRNRSFSRKGLCVVCGYDLRASPERCPECGTETLTPTLSQRGLCINDISSQARDAENARLNGFARRKRSDGAKCASGADLWQSRIILQSTGRGGNSEEMPGATGEGVKKS